MLAFLPATLAAWFLTDLWLQDFAYRIPMPWWAFVVAGLVAVTVVLLTIGVQGIRAALANPVERLRSE